MIEEVDNLYFLGLIIDKYEVAHTYAKGCK